MKINIDTFEQDNGWVVVGSGSVEVTDWSNISPSYRNNQLMFKLKKGDVCYLEFNEIDVSIAKMLSVYVMPQYNGDNLTANISFSNNSKSLKYKFVFPHIPAQFVVINELNSINKITIEAIEDVNFILSDFIAFVDEMPMDIYLGIKELLDYYNIDKLYCGNVTASAGDSSITVDNMKYINEYSFIEFNGETHRVLSVSDNVIELDSYAGDGGIVKNDADNVPIYLKVYVNIEGGADNMATIPSINIFSGFQVEPLQKIETISENIESQYADDNVAWLRSTGVGFSYLIRVEGEYYDGDSAELILNLFKRAFNKQSVIWVNGTQSDVISDNIQQPDYGDENDIIGKIIADIKVEVVEDKWQAEKIRIGLTPILKVGVKTL